ncbi:MAG: hypothetical protein ACREEU_05970, partial [Acetobacteraceae bacterium]
MRKLGNLCGSAKRPCNSAGEHLDCASQQYGIAGLPAFLGRFLPKLGGAKSPAIFFVGAKSPAIFFVVPQSHRSGARLPSNSGAAAARARIRSVK